MSRTIKKNSEYGSLQICEALFGQAVSGPVYGRLRLRTSTIACVIVAVRRCHLANKIAIPFLKIADYEMICQISFKIGILMCNKSEDPPS